VAGRTGVTSPPGETVPSRNLGALGLLLGPTPQWVGAAATGSCALMISALVVRVRIEDPWHVMLPAFILLLGNAWLAMRGWRGG